MYQNLAPSQHRCEKVVVGLGEIDVEINPTRSIRICTVPSRCHPVFVGSIDTNHFVTSGDEIVYDDTTDQPGGSGYDDSHYH